MKLYIVKDKEMLKAVSSVPNTARDSEDETQTKREYEESFSENPPGVTGEGAAYDDPKKGKKWKDGEPLQVELEQAREDEEKRLTKLGVIKSSSTEVLKSISAQFKEYNRENTPNSIEREFLKSVLGFTEDDIHSGRARITGRNRDLFGRWLCGRLEKSVSNLGSKVRL